MPALFRNVLSCIISSHGIQFFATYASLELSPEIFAFEFSSHGFDIELIPMQFLQGTYYESHAHTFLLAIENCPMISSDITFSFGISTISGTEGHISSSLHISMSKNFISVSPLLMVMSKYLGACLPPSII